MIKQVLRQDIFSSNKNITSMIQELQNSMHEEDGFETEEDKVEYDGQFDALNLECKHVEQFNCVLQFPHDSIDTYTSALSDKIARLLESNAVESLYIISTLKMKLFGAKRNNSVSLKESLLSFEKLTGIKNTKEALEVDIEQLPQALETFFWLQRLDTSSPEFVYFTDKEDRFAFNICKYGNIHLVEFKAELITNDFLENEGWEIMNERCYDQLSDHAIKERQDSR